VVLRLLVSQLEFLSLAGLMVIGIIQPMVLSPPQTLSMPHAND
jgi:hypothetical protein